MKPELLVTINPDAVESDAKILERGTLWLRKLLGERLTEFCKSHPQIASKTDRQDLTAVNAFRLLSAEIFQANEGDPYVPTPWEWVNCSTTTPPRITKIVFSRRNVKGEIPPELKNMDALTKLWLDGNLLKGERYLIRNAMKKEILDALTVNTYLHTH